MRSRHLQALAGLTALGALLRFAALGEQSYWGDEGATVALIRASFGDMLDRLPDSESTPPLYYAIAWVWTRALGSSEEWGLRSLSALAGTATIPVAYAAAAELVTRRAGLVTAALVACSPLLVWYSQESRAYALMTLLIALTLWLFARALDESERVVARGHAWWALAAVLAVATHYFAAFVVAPQAVWLIARARDPARRRAAIAATAAVVVAGGALLPLALDQRSTGNTAYIAEIAFDQRVKEVPKKFLVGEQATPGDYGTVIEALKWPALALALLAAVLAVTRTDRRERSGAVLAAGVGAAGLALPLALKAVGLDYFAAYNLQGLWLPLAVAAAAGLGARAAGRTGVAAAAALCAIGGAVVVSVATDPDLHRNDYRDLAGRLGEEPRAVVATPRNSLSPLAAYLPRIDHLPAGHRVREIAIVGMRAQDESTRARAWDPAYRPHLPGFRVTRRADAHAYTLIVLRAPRPLPVDLERLQAVRLGTGEAALIRQR